MNVGDTWLIVTLMSAAVLIIAAVIHGDLQSWYDDMTGSQRMLIWLVSLASIIFAGAGIAATLMMLYLKFGSRTA